MAQYDHHNKFSRGGGGKAVMDVKGGKGGGGGKGGYGAKTIIEHVPMKTKMEPGAGAPAKAKMLVHDPYGATGQKAVMSQQHDAERSGAGSKPRKGGRPSEAWLEYEEEEDNSQPRNRSKATMEVQSAKQPAAKQPAKAVHETKPQAAEKAHAAPKAGKKDPAPKKDAAPPAPTPAEEPKPAKAQPEKKQAPVKLQSYTTPSADAAARGPLAGKLGQRADEAAIVSNRTFAEMRVRRNVCTALRREGILNPLPIQDKVLPLGQRDYDIYAMAEDGCGKTLAWVVVALQRIAEAGGWEERADRMTPGVLALMPTAQKVTEAVKVLRRLGGTGVVGLGEPDSSAAAKGAVRYVVGTIESVVKAVKAKEISFAQLLTFVVDGWGHARVSEVQALVRAITDDLGKGNEYQSIVFSSTMQSALDKWMLPKMRVDRVVFQSMTHPLPHQVGQRFSFLRVRGNTDKHVLLRDLTSVPAMDNIVVVADREDIKELRLVLTDRHHELSVWTDPNNHDEHEVALGAIMSDAQATVLLTPECFTELDMDPEQSEVAMWVFYSPLSCLELFETRRNIYHRTCRSFVATLISHEAHEMEAAEDFINTYDLPGIVDCHPYHTSLPSIILGAPAQQPPPQAQLPQHQQPPPVQKPANAHHQDYAQHNGGGGYGNGREAPDDRRDERGNMFGSHSTPHQDVAPRQAPERHYEHRREPREEVHRWSDDHGGRNGTRAWRNRQRASSEVEDFIAEYRLDHPAADSLRSLSMGGAEMVVRTTDLRTARNPSAIVMKKVLERRAAERTAGPQAGGYQGGGGMRT